VARAKEREKEGEPRKAGEQRGERSFQASLKALCFNIGGLLCTPPATVPSNYVRFLVCILARHRQGKKEIVAKDEDGDAPTCLLIGGLRFTLHYYCSTYAYI